ncbi:hydrogen peroxide-inducible genes activator [Flavobacterium silvaticum]|uniref:LysR family transcriptional regulator n=1 Tax=Flavobacterium silvaticum TaxID=1852020 RepID=A0A972FSK7_9FLAO|nr:hydrogen peroxide-inducible genes activator [Flavobacterium silvaticum]NMH28594.1 LysR family transcriptional regulator [Flavobacterium silvaticum]
MTLQQLKYIIALDNHRHFARAAEASLISQPGLTTQLKNLEEEIGIKIFDRSKVPMVPTKEGSEIIVRARKVLRESESIREFVIDRKNSLEGEIRIGVISTLSPYLVPSFIMAMQRIAPKVKMIITERPTGLLIRDLESGQIDVALMATPTGQSGLSEHSVFDEPFVAYLPNDQYPEEKVYTLKAEDKNRLLFLQYEFCYNAQLLDICNLKDEAVPDEKFSYEISSIETLKNLVRAGLGFAIIPQLSVQHETDGFVRPLQKPTPVRQISLVTTDTFSRQLLVEKMQQAILDCLPEELKLISADRKIRWNDSPYFAKKMEQFQ